MLHWIEHQDPGRWPVWHRYVECSHWGLFFTDELIMWEVPGVPIFRNPSIFVTTT